MARLPSISKYCVVCWVGALAFALSHVYIMLTPSMGLCLMPLIVSGCGMPVASRMVGTMSMTWLNWRRMPPTSLMWPGQDMAMPWDVPPKCDGTCFTHLNGVSIAHAHSAAKCGNVLSDPQNGYQRYWAFTGTGTPLKVVNSFGVPLSMPSALAPLSPLM